MVTNQEDEALARTMVEEELAEIYVEEGRGGEEITGQDIVALQANEEYYFEDLQEDAEQAEEVNEEENDDEVEVVDDVDEDDDVVIIDLVSDGE